MVGHGLGRKLHEAPEVPNYGKRGQGVQLKTGMALAIVLVDVSSSSVVLAAIAGGALSLVMGLYFSAEKIVYELRR